MTDRPGLSDTVMDHFLHPRHAGELPEASGEGWAGSPESGRYMRIQVRLEGNRLAELGFGTYGCAPAIAAGSFLCEWACGRTIDEAMGYTAQRLLRSLGWLPKHRRDCAMLAVEALARALADAGACRRDSSGVLHPLAGQGGGPPD